MWGDDDYNERPSPLYNSDDDRKEQGILGLAWPVTFVALALVLGHIVVLILYVIIHLLFR